MIRVLARSEKTLRGDSNNADHVLLDPKPCRLRRSSIQKEVPICSHTFRLPHIVFSYSDKS